MYNIRGLMMRDGGTSGTILRTETAALFLARCCAFIVCQTQRCRRTVDIHIVRASVDYEAARGRS